MSVGAAVVGTDVGKISGLFVVNTDGEKVVVGLCDGPWVIVGGKVPVIGAGVVGSASSNPCWQSACAKHNSPSGHSE